MIPSLSDSVTFGNWLVHPIIVVKVLIILITSYLTSLMITVKTPGIRINSYLVRGVLFHIRFLIDIIRTAVDVYFSRFLLNLMELLPIYHAVTTPFDDHRSHQDWLFSPSSLKHSFGKTPFCNVFIQPLILISSGLKWFSQIYASVSEFNLNVLIIRLLARKKAKSSCIEVLGHNLHTRKWRGISEMKPSLLYYRLIQIS